MTTIAGAIYSVFLCARPQTTALGVLLTLFIIKLAPTLRGRHDYPHLQTKKLRLSEVTQLESGGAESELV